MSKIVYILDIKVEESFNKPYEYYKNLEDFSIYKPIAIPSSKSYEIEIIYPELFVCHETNESRWIGMSQKVKEHFDILNVGFESIKSRVYFLQEQNRSILNGNKRLVQTCNLFEQKIAFVKAMTFMQRLIFLFRGAKWKKLLL